MYLSRIEMTGFKSFADKTVIEFDRGMTAVVGPNGSGKSNLSEAIRWVLGEQSAKSLRGSKMEDVIFNGTQKRKPVNLARVTLVLNNEDRYLDLDYAEIAISRSFNRNGESQYAINKEPCRMKDIVDLLMDSGLGKNSFSIISQGQVERILLNKAEDRRAIFEEAAGVQKYQYRKLEAERKLEKSRDHLSRVKDILYELGLQMTPLKDQKDKALQYQELKSLLTDQEIALYTHQIADYKAQWEQGKGAVDELEAHLATLEQDRQQQDRALAEAKQAFNDLVDHGDHLGQAQQTLLQAIERKRSQIQIQEQESQFAQTNQSQQGEALAKARQDLADLEEKWTANQLQLKDKAASAQAVNRQLKSAQQERQALMGRSEENVEALRSQMMDLYQERAHQANHYQTTLDQIQQKESRLDRLRQQLQRDRLQSEEIQAKVKQEEARLADIQARLATMQGDVATRQARLSQDKVQTQADRATLFNLEREVNHLQGTYESLKHKQESYNGYFAGVRGVMTAGQSLKGIHGPVADLIQVDETLQTAIEIALGGAAQNIVVENDQAAKEAIAFLKTRRLGRATFLPIPNIKAKSFPEQTWAQLREKAGVVGLANQLVSFEGPYQAIIDHLLGPCLVVETIDLAQQLAGRFGHRLKIVTLTGDLILPGGSITGGHVRQTQDSMLSQKKALNRARSAFTQAQDRLKQLAADYESRGEAQDRQQAELGALQQAFSQLDQEKQAVSLVIGQDHYQIQSLEKVLKLGQMDQEELQRDIRHLKQAVLDQAEQRQANDQEIEAIQQALTQATLSAEDRQQASQMLERTIADLKTQAAILQVELQQGQERDRDWQEQIVALKQRLQQGEASTTHSHTHLQELHQTIQALQAELTTMEDQAQSQQRQLDEAKEERHQRQVEIDRLESQAKVLQDQYQTTYRQMDKLEGQMDKFQTFIDNFLTYLNDEYQLTYEMAAQRAHPIDSVKDRQDSVRHLRRQIESLGPVNLQAIDDYEELSQRFNHLSEQEADLLEAMDQLQTTMDAMDAEVVQRFSHTFEVINHHFKLAFRHLFGGGDATLTLTEPDQILTTGVDIIAQPPGKKKQALALLSGGERALTAIALLFAILEAKPVPFVVLDEVEAALDDANVDRYGQYIRAFTQQTQFIVITHRKGTMEHADVLYGVTMQESGISRLASVRLQDAVVE